MYCGTPVRQVTLTRRTGIEPQPGLYFCSLLRCVPDRSKQLGDGKIMDLLGRVQLAYFAAKARLPERLVLRTAEETAARFSETWPEERRALPHRILAAIETHVSRVASVKATF